MDKYNHKKIEEKWQKYWKKEKLYQTGESKYKPKYYVLDMFPYPSGAGLHVGHPKGYIATDIFARAKMMQGYNVLHPMGWDAFGLPTENYAIANKIHPRAATEKNIEIFKNQLGKLGFTYDWEREINTTDPEYYRWTQWAFIKMFERGLAYESNEPVNWCPSCKTVLANEDLENGKCERCDSEVERKPMRQWVLKITAYADRLLKDLEKLPDWEEPIKEMQRNWIGRKEGAEVEFRIKNYELRIKVFTTRPDTLFGATFMVISPEHKLIKDLRSGIKNWVEVEKYINAVKKKSDLERTDLNKEKTGVKLEGIIAVNPVNQEKIPIFVADYVLTGYGTGAIMAVPAHDERDWEFAKKYNLPVRQVITPNYREYKLTIETLETLKEIYEAAEKKDIKFWLLGGLACAFYAGIIYRAHEDLDLIAKDEVSRDKFVKLLVKLGFKKIREKKISENLVNFVYQRGKIEVDIGPNKGEFGLADDFEEDIKCLGKYKTRVLSKRFVKVFKEYQLKNRKEEKDRLDYEYLNGKAFIEDGIVVNSDKYSGLASNEVKQKIGEWLEEKKLGKHSVNYKLRDWVFSRQRYWGEPIPIVHCEHCKNKKYNFIFIHGYSSSGNEGYRPWLKRELESRGHKVYSPDLPNTAKPNVNEQADFIIKNFQLEENTILIGGSLGGAVLMRILEKIEIKIAKAVFVDSVLKPKFADKDRPDVAVAHNWKFDFKRIRKASDSFIVLADRDFPVILKEHSEELARELNTGVIYVKPNNRHFSKSETEPAVLKLFENTGLVAVPYDELPLKLPEVKNYEPTGTGESPLANIKDWVNTKCPKCGGKAKRETNTMPQWAGSSWYYLRYIDPKNDQALVAKAKEKYWSPVDFYVGGAEHATRHLIYARFWHKFLFDIGAVNYDEPFTRLRHVGLILAEDGRKMSKRWNNVINPDEIVEKFGADAMRVYEMFMGPFSQPCAWSTNGLSGARRFLENVYKLKDKKLYDCRGGDCDIKESGLPNLLHKTIKKVSGDIENFHYNTAISQMMIFMNFAGKFNELPRGAFENFLKLLAPFAPHLAEELWAELGHPSAKVRTGKESIFKQPWPKFNPELAKDETISLVVQINGKVRDNINVSFDISQKEAEKIALESEKVKKWLDGKEVKKVIFVKGRLVNIVI